ncbi:hypothetical protein VTI74DRAFT_10039 [Chaetomium olivicolor]
MFPSSKTPENRPVLRWHREQIPWRRQRQQHPQNLPYVGQDSQRSVPLLPTWHRHLCRLQQPHPHGHHGQDEVLVHESERLGHWLVL